MRSIRVVVAAAGLAAVACGRTGVERGGVEQSASTRAVTDSLAGVVREVGADPATRVVLSPAGGGQDLPLLGDTALALRSVAGAEVLVRGRSTQDGFAVSGFTVRSVNGVAVDDGVVARSGSGLELVLQSGGRRSLPPALDGMVGSRVWVSRPEPGRAPSFGLIR